LRPQHKNHVWSYDFIEDRTHDGRKYRMLNVIDEFTHECLAIRIDHKLKAIDVIDVLSDLFILRGVPGHIRSDNGPEFVAKAVQGWIAAVGAKTAYIAPGSPWENASSRASMPACGTSCSTARSSTPSRRRRS
jgi:transposase InsO family protein